MNRKGFGNASIKSTLAVSLSGSTDVPKEIEMLWNHSTTSLPRILLARDCWDEEHLPTSTKLILSTFDNIDAARATGTCSYTVYRRGESSATTDPRLAIAQLSNPTNACPVVLIGLDIVPESVFHVPISLSEFVEGHDESNQQMLLTPKFSLTDLHIDSADGISSPIGQCKKLWLLFPPTTLNLTLMKEAEGQRAKLQRIGKSLEGGIVATTNSDQAIYLPAGCIHAVVTIQGGFLISIDFTTPLSSKPTAALITAGLDDGISSPSFQKEVFDRLLASVDHGLSNKKEHLAVDSWISVLGKIQEYGKSRQAWKKQGTKVWDEFLATKRGKDMVCVCGEQGKAKFPEHFRREHLWGNVKAQKRKADSQVVEDPREKRVTRAIKRLKSR